MSAGLTAEGIRRLHEVAQRNVDDDQVPGLVALAARGDQVHVEALGTMAIGGPPWCATRSSGSPRTPSRSRPRPRSRWPRRDCWTSTSRLTGCCPNWPVNRVLRRMDGPLDDTVAAGRAITVRDLLSFTFGFGLAAEMFFSPEPWPVVEAANALDLGTPMPADVHAQPDPDTWIARFGTLPLLAQPGERWFYNTSASVLGVLAARAAGQPFGEVLRTRLFEPLGMRDTAFWTPAGDRLPDGTGRPRRAGRVGPAGRVVEQAARVRGRRGRARVHRRRPAGLLPDDAPRRRPGAAGQRRARDDQILAGRRPRRSGRGYPGAAPHD